MLEIDDAEISDEDDDDEDIRELAPLPSPREATDLIGHMAVDAMLQGLVNGGAMPHAVIFAGSAGIGKATAAFRLARLLLARPGAADDVARKVASGGHPDLLVVERPHDDRKDRRRDAVDIDSIRRIAPFMHMTASQDGGWRVAIVDDADTMTTQAQNAILKILEEPPSRAVLILVCHRIGGLIPTIRSRCPRHAVPAAGPGKFHDARPPHRSGPAPARARHPVRPCRPAASARRDR